jgi:hypothetical protein
MFFFLSIVLYLNLLALFFLLDEEGPDKVIFIGLIARTTIKEIYHRKNQKKNAVVDSKTLLLFSTFLLSTGFLTNLNP